MRKLIVVGMIAAVSVASCVAQTRSSQSSVFALKGKVVDRRGVPAGAALVYLKDTRSRILKIKRAGRDGKFVFTWLDARLDYEIYAERDDLASEKVPITGSQKAPEMLITVRLSRNR